ncbi:hypothetical protein PHSY_000280 [Pseudozyma hubeiensis SY62]|uniref:DNA repair metallo-beta-lactamase domain-containing protein n=1 Tax=Pseudozyma hubeiensis (strain SY62) TaxID=1305764 RepID=R9P3Q0_PSEHS|nr:hypothetical protein PHSY_000280 [Pseudozyma hubeiensis SY62]GAC92725.1 hypothetical protein PHSY_000280 [Pseudozyma hubeiensis SY62]
MAPSAVASPPKRRKVASSSPSKQAGPSGTAQPSLLSFFGNGPSSSSSPNRSDSLQRTPSDQQHCDEPRLDSKAESTADCPICGRKIPFNTVQAHVNTCLDAADTIDQEPQVLRDHVNEQPLSPAKDASPGQSCSPAPPADILRPLKTEAATAQRLTQPQPAKLTSISELASTLDATVAPTNASIQGTGVTAQAVSGTKSSTTPSSILSSAKRADSSAFTVLMKSHSESKQWATADAVEAANYRGKARSRPDARTAPFYKALEGMPLTVDAFRFGKIEGCRGYFLTHFHSDHYGGMTANWNHGPIYCSLTSANLCRTHLGVDPQWLRPLPMEVPVLVPDSGGVTVTCIEANHCPGSCLFLFEGPQTSQLLSRNHASPYIGTGRIFRYLHCGDFRASPVHTNHPSIIGKKLDIIYLDTTYCNPRYCFPAQDQVIEACAELVRRIVPEAQLECNKALMQKQIEAGEREDWTQAPPRKLKGSVDTNSASANAFKGWFETKVENPDGTITALRPPSISRDSSSGEIKFEEESDAVSIKQEEAQDESLGYDDEDLFDQEDPVEEDGVYDRPANASEQTSVPRVKLEPSDDSLLDVPFASEKADDQVKVEPTDSPAREMKEEDDSKPDVKATTPDDATASNWLTKHSETSRDAVSSMRRRDGGRLLVVIGTYTIGKERIVKAVARAMNSKIFCMDSRKYRVYAQLEDPELHSMLTRSPSASVHVTNLHAINGEGLRDVVAALRTRGHDFTHAVAFRPTGWTYKPPAGMDTVSPSLDRLIQWNQSRSFGFQNLYPTRDSTPDYMIYGVPYSEHSSFFELTAFALSTRYDRIIATVNVGNPTSRAKMAKWFEKWMLEKRRREKHGLSELDARAITYW